MSERCPACDLPEAWVRHHGCRTHDQPHRRDACPRPQWADGRRPENRPPLAALVPPAPER